MRALSLRTLWGTLTALVVAGSVVGPAALQVAAAATGTGSDLIISEVNFGGAPANPDDQWIELYNPTSSSVVFSAANTYHLVVGTKDTALSSGTIIAHGYYLVSTLGASSTVSSDLTSAALDITQTDTQISLENAALMPVDQFGDGTKNLVDFVASVPGSVPADVSALERTSVPSDGASSLAWKYSRTIGHGFSTSVGTTMAVQYGTPENAAGPVVVTGLPANPNPELALIDTLSVTGAANNVNPDVKGSFVAATSDQSLPTSVTLKVVSALDGSVVLPAVSGTITPVDATHATFDIPTALFTPGVYRMTVTYGDVAKDRGMTMTVPVAGSVQNVYTIVSGTVPAVPDVTLVTPSCVTGTATYAAPCYTAATVVTLSGPVVAGTDLVISINGTQVSTDITSAKTTFDLPVQLVPDTQNSIEVRAKNGFGYSEPRVIVVNQITQKPVLTASIVANQPGTADTVTGTATQILSAPVMVSAYADAAMTKAIGTSVAVTAADGSFAFSIGDNQYPDVYLVAKDVLGLVSDQVHLVNPIAFAGTVSYAVSNVSQNQVTLTVAPVSGAVNYLLKYKAGTAAYSTPILLCASPSSCVLQRQIVNLASSTAYTFAVAPVDQYGNVGAYAEQTATTSAPVVVAVAETATPAPVATATPAPVKSAVKAATATPTPAPEATATPSASPEAGAVQSAQTDNSRNYTPWIILAVLIGLAILATAGYFYWFGGEAGAAVDGTAPVAAKQDTESAVKSGESKPVVPVSKTNAEPSAGAPKKDKEKRW